MSPASAFTHRFRQAVVLAGGRGTRLGELTDSVPKPLLPIDSRPFLQFLIEDLRDAGIVDIVISIGYLFEHMQVALQDGKQWGVRISYVVETAPLGTGGALALAVGSLPFPGEPFWVCNGDTIVDVPFDALCQTMAQTDAWAGLVTRCVNDTTRYGTVHTDKQGLVRNFNEKFHAVQAQINAGVYLFTEQALWALPCGTGSLEQQTFPALAAKGRLAAVASTGFFLDIGLPETYALAKVSLPERSLRKSCCCNI